MKTITIGNVPRMDYFVQSEIDRLRVNVGFAGQDKKIIMITSSDPNEGKSYISINLWRELARAGKRVCFVDADMRKSVLRTTLQLQTSDATFGGLAHYLAGYTDEDEEANSFMYYAEKQGAYMIPTTTLINPSLLLEGERFDILLQNLRKSFDYIIIDTPPLGIVSDGQMIARKCDGCILVIRADSTKRSVVRSSIKQLEQAECPILGVVLNRAGTKSKGRSYYSKEYYYYTDGKKKKKRRSRSESGAEAAVQDAPQAPENSGGNSAPQDSDN